MSDFWHPDAGDGGWIPEGEDSGWAPEGQHWEWWADPAVEDGGQWVLMNDDGTWAGYAEPTDWTFGAGGHQADAAGDGTVEPGAAAGVPDPASDAIAVGADQQAAWIAEAHAAGWSMANLAERYVDLYGRAIQLFADRAKS